MARRRAYVSLGGNVGQPAATLRAAIGRLRGLGDLVAVSPAYRTDPVGPVAQPRFLNAVAALDTELEPLALLDALQAIEAEFGRVRGVRFGPRTLDLDLISMDGEQRADARLELPHPRAHEREFVLRPLADLDPGLELRGRPVREWLAALPPQGVERADVALT
jgi:2-amino-4-hydroxy-6-hydroxymethyldihydropteridine diphosphokinase